MLGCLKDSLFDLHEGVAWGLLSPEFESQQRQQLLNAAANELHTDKQLCLQLAREHGILEEYAAQVKVGAALQGSERVQVRSPRSGVAPLPRPALLLHCTALRCPALQKPQHHTVSDYERVGELKFGLLVWRANLKRDASLASDGQELEKQLADAYTDALRWAGLCRAVLQHWSGRLTSSPLHLTVAAQRAQQTDARGCGPRLPAG